MGARKRGLKRTEGHAAGEEALFDTVEGALELGLRWLTVYAFSTENWRRPVDEVRYLMGFNETILMRRRDELHERGVRIRFAGRRDWRVPAPAARASRTRRSTLTRGNRRMTLTFAFNYGGRAEIVDAVRALVAEGAQADEITEKAIRPPPLLPDMPDPDLVVRTSGEFRISNFLLWELAYSELVFTDVLWPDFRREHLVEAVREFQRRDRRFGGVEAQVTPWPVPRHGRSCCAPTSWARPTASSCCSRPSTARCGPWPRACARRRAASAAGSSR